MILKIAIDSLANYFNGGATFPAKKVPGSFTKKATKRLSKEQVLAQQRRNGGLYCFVNDHPCELGFLCLKNVIAQILQLYDEPERDKVLFRQISAHQWNLIDGRIERLFMHKVWDDPNPEVANQLKVNAADQVRNFLAAQRLTANLVLGGEGP